MKWTVLAAKLFQAIHNGDKETEQRLYAIMDEKKAKKKAKKVLQDDELIEDDGRIQGTQ